MFSMLRKVVPVLVTGLVVFSLFACSPATTADEGIVIVISEDPPSTAESDTRGNRSEKPVHFWRCGCRQTIIGRGDPQFSRRRRDAGELADRLHLLTYELQLRLIALGLCLHLLLLDSSDTRVLRHAGLLELLDDPAEPIRLASIWSLSQIGGEGVREKLEELYDETEDEH